MTNGLLAISELGELRLYDSQKFALRGTHTFGRWIEGLREADTRHLYIMLQSQGVAILDTKTMASHLMLALPTRIRSLSVAQSGEIALALPGQVRLYAPSFSRLERVILEPSNLTNAIYGAHDTLYVLAGKPPRLHVYSKGTGREKIITATDLHENARLFADKSGRLYIIDDYCGASNRRVLSLQQHTYVVRTLIRGVQEVRGMAVADDGALYLAERGCNEFNRSGVFDYGAPGSNDSSALGDLPYGALYLRP